MCTHIHIRTHTRAPTHTRMHAPTHTRTHTHPCMPVRLRMHTRAPVHAPTHTHPHTHACTHARMHACAYTRSRTMHTHHTRMRDKTTRSRIPLKRIRSAYNAFFACSAWQCSTTRRKRLKTALIAPNHAQTCSHLSGPDTRRRASAMLHCTINDKPRTGRGLSGSLNKLLHGHEPNNFCHFSPVCWICNNWNRFIPACTAATALPIIRICFAQFRICRLGI